MPQSQLSVVVLNCIIGCLECRSIMTLQANLATSHFTSTFSFVSHFTIFRSLLAIIIFKLNSWSFNDSITTWLFLFFLTSLLAAFMTQRKKKYEKSLAGAVEKSPSRGVETSKKWLITTFRIGMLHSYSFSFKNKKTQLWSQLKVQHRQLRNDHHRSPSFQVDTKPN